MNQVTRKSSVPIKVYCLPSERAQIEGAAKVAGLSTSRYLLSLGMSYRLKNLIDHQRVDELARMHGDLVRLGGLLNLWLRDDPRTLGLEEQTLLAVLSKIAEIQSDMQRIMRAVVLPHARSRSL